MLVSYRNTKRRHNSEELDLNFHRRENLKCHIKYRRRFAFLRRCKPRIFKIAVTVCDVISV